MILDGDDISKSFEVKREQNEFNGKTQYRVMHIYNSHLIMSRQLYIYIKMFILMCILKLYLN